MNVVWNFVQVELHRRYGKRVVRSPGEPGWTSIARVVKQGAVRRWATGEQFQDDGGMRKVDLVKGKNYALRPKGAGPGSSDCFVKVVFLGLTHGRQCKVLFDSGELAGLEDWVVTRDLACRWGERKALIRDEERWARIEAATDEMWDEVIEEAISAVMEASGEQYAIRRYWADDPTSAQRYWDRAKLHGTPLEYDPLNYEDRDGTWHFSFATALKAAQAFAAAEPELVDLYLRSIEEELKAEGFVPGMRHRHDLLRKYAPSHALVRAWSQAPRGIAAENETTRLRAVVSQAVRFLREAGEGRKADQIERGLHGR